MHTTTSSFDKANYNAKRSLDNITSDAIAPKKETLEHIELTNSSLFDRKDESKNLVLAPNRYNQNLNLELYRKPHF